MDGRTDGIACNEDQARDLKPTLDEGKRVLKSWGCPLPLKTLRGK